MINDFVASSFLAGFKVFFAMFLFPPVLGVPTVSLTKNLYTAFASLDESGQRLGGFEFLGLLQGFLCHVLVSSVFFGRPPALGRRGTLCILIAKKCREIEDLLCPCNSDTCAEATVRVGDGTGGPGVELINLELNRSTDGRGLFEDDLPRAVAAEAEAGAAVVVGESVAVEGAGALQAVNNHRGGVAEQVDLNLGPSGVVKFVAGRKDYSQDFASVEDQAVRRDVNVFGGHEAVHGGAVVFEPRRVPGFPEVVELLTQRRVFHIALFPATSWPLPPAPLTESLGRPLA